MTTERICGLGKSETSKGLVVVADNKEAARVISESSVVKKLEIKVDHKRKRRPRIIIYDIDRSLPHVKVLALIREQKTELNAYVV